MASETTQENAGGKSRRKSRRAAQDAPSPGAAPGVAAIAPGHRSLIWLQGLLCGALATIATPTAVLTAVLLAPGLAAAIMDSAPGKPRARTMLLFGGAALVAPMNTLWSTGHTLATALALAADMDVVGLAWLAAAGGWLLTEIAPVLVRAVLEAMAIARTTALRAQRARHAAEWDFGTDIAPPD